MTFLRRSLLSLALVLSAVPATAAAQAAMPSDSLAHARKLTNWLYSGQADSIHAYMAPGDDGKRISTDEIRSRLEEMTVRAGTETEVIEEKFVKRNGNTQYWRIGKWSVFTDEPVVFRWAFNKSGQIIGIGFNPLSKAPPIDPK